MFLKKICANFDKHKIPYAIVGGYAVALHGCTRGTIDIDLVTKIDLNTFKKIEKFLLNMGLQSRLPISGEDVFNFRDEYMKNRNLVAWNFFNPRNPLESVDIIITHDVTNFQIVTKKVENQNIHIISVEDLIEMKQSSGRPQDLEDVRALESR